MMMKNIYMKIMKLAAFIAVSFSLASCLEKIPGDYIPEGEAMKTFSDAEQTLTGIYSAYMSSALYSGYLTLCPDIQSDLVYAVQGNSNTFGNIWLWDIRSTNSEVEAVYAALYRVIGLCNFYLDQVDDLRAGFTDDESITYLDYYTGEVLCARAMAYSELIKCFCKAYTPDTADEEQGGVAIDSTYFGQKPLKRSTLRESYEFVIRDLKKAEELLEDAPYGYSSPYFTYAAANAIHARTALYMQDWDDAIKYSTRLIEDDAYALSTAATYTTGVSPITGAQKAYSYIDYMWTNDLSFEIIWRVAYTVTSYGGALGQCFLNFNNDYTYYYPNSLDYTPYTPVGNSTITSVNSDILVPGGSFTATISSGADGTNNPVSKYRIYFSTSKTVTSSSSYVDIPKSKLSGNNLTITYANLSSPARGSTIYLGI